MLVIPKFIIISVIKVLCNYPQRIYLKIYKNLLTEPAGPDSRKTIIRQTDRHLAATAIFSQFLNKTTR